MNVSCVNTAHKPIGRPHKSISQKTEITPPFVSFHCYYSSLLSHCLMLNTRIHHYQNVLIWNRRAQFPERTHKSMIPKVTHIHIHWSRRELGMTPETITGAWCGLFSMTGHDPKIHYSTSSVAAWRLREGDIVGISVILRGEEAMDFRSTVVNVVLPQVRPFEGFSTSTVDNAGNCTLPRSNPLLFPSLQPNYERFRPLTLRSGLTITLHTNSAAAGGTNERIIARSLSLLTGLGRPMIHGIK